MYSIFSGCLNNIYHTLQQNVIWPLRLIGEEFYFQTIPVVVLYVMKLVMLFHCMQESHILKCFILCYASVELTWCSGSVMDCHATARGSIPCWNGVFTELHVHRKGQ